MAWGARVALRRPPRNRLKIGVRGEGTVSDDILETRRLLRTDGGDPASICSVARRVSFLGIKRVVGKECFVHKQTLEHEFLCRNPTDFVRVANACR